MTHIIKSSDELITDDVLLNGEILLADDLDGGAYYEKDTVTN